MKNFYVFVAAFVYSLLGADAGAQCGVGIAATQTNTGALGAQITCSVPGITLTATPSPATGAVYEWTGLSTATAVLGTAAALDVVLPDVYTVKLTVPVTDGAGNTSTCVSTASIVVTQDKNPPVVIASAIPGRRCQGDTINLVASGAADFVWNPGNLAGPFVKVIADPAVSAYTVTATGANGCPTTETVNVIVNPLPQASITNTASGPVCQNSTAPPIEFRGTAGTRPFTFAYTVNGGNTQLITSAPGSDAALLVPSTVQQGVFNYTLISVTDSNGCTRSQLATASFSVTQGPVLQSPKTHSVCDTLPVNYTASSSLPANTTFAWQRAAAANITNPAGSGTGPDITEKLSNNTAQPQPVAYVFTLTSGGCSSTETVTVTVNPTPKLDSIADRPFCNGTAVPGIAFRTASPNASFSWRNSNTRIGLPASGNGNIPAFTATNIRVNQPDTALITVSIKASADSCRGRDTSFRIIVGPGPALVSPKAVSVCDGKPFSYLAVSSAPGITNFRWVRLPSANVTATGPGRGNTALITDVLINNTAAAQTVTYVDTLSLASGAACINIETITVTVNPTPRIAPLRDTVFCNGTAVAGIPFSTAAPNAVFTWTNSDPTIGLPASGVGNIPAFTASNGSNTVKNASILVSVKASGDSCAGTPVSFTIRVNPSPPRPGFTSVSSVADNDTLRLCNGSENLNFNVSSPAATARYNWAVAPAGGGVVVRNPARPNTVISFTAPGTYNVVVTATDAATGCQSLASQAVTVSTAGNGIPLEKIFLMQPGDVLVYPDNALIGYQWGYDEVTGAVGDSVFGVPVVLAGQVRHFYVPGQPLNTARYLYWVQLQNGNRCRTKVYYNGPYAGLRQPLLADAGNEVQMQVLPNPARSAFALALKGNIYGKMDVRIYNAVGRLVMKRDFVKTAPETTEQFKDIALPAGIYFIELHSADLKKLVTRFAVQR